MHPISGFPTTRTATTRAATTRTERSFPLFLLGSHPYPFPLHLYRLDSMTRAPCPRPRRHDAMTPHRRARTDSTAHVSTNGSARVEVVSFPLSSYHLSHASFLYVSSAVKCGAVQCDAVQTHHTLTHNPPPPHSLSPLFFLTLTLPYPLHNFAIPRSHNPTIPQSHYPTIPAKRETRKHSHLPTMSIHPLRGVRSWALGSASFSCFPTSPYLLLSSLSPPPAPFPFFLSPFYLEHTSSSAQSSCSCSFTFTFLLLTF